MGASSIPAAPNRSRIQGRLTGFRRDATYADKLWIHFELLASQDLPPNPNFAKNKIGKEVQGFTFEDISTLKPDDVFMAIAEYIGDAQTGFFRLCDIEKLPTQ